MSYPELYSDEHVVLQAQNVKVKSVLFEIVLTTRRLVLIDTKKNSIPPQEINLATLKDVESGENAIRDPTITISIITISGNTRQMVLTFSKISGGERRRECDDWVRALRQNITSMVYHPVTQVPVPKDSEPASAVPSPVPVPHRTEIPNPPPPKKRIEIARPMKKIVEAAPVMPVPVETTSLPTGTFCNRCGNRVPPESAFCNRCGTPVVQDTGAVNQTPEDDISFEQPASAVPQIQLTPPAASYTETEKKDRPIEQVIHSIEPLIEDSVPRTAPSPLIPAKQTYYTPQVDTAEPASQVPQAAANPGSMDAAAPMSGVQWPVLPTSGTTDAAGPTAVPVTPSVTGSMLPTQPPRKIPIRMIAVLALVILAVIAGVYVFMQNPDGTPGVTPTPGITIPATTIPPATITAVTTTKIPPTTAQLVTTPSVVIPTSGVYVRVSYSGKYSGSVGTPGRLREITELGGPFYQISTVDGPVVVSIQKDDGSSAQMAVDVYKDGTLMKHTVTNAPNGMVEFQASVKTVAANTPAAP